MQTVTSSYPITDDEYQALERAFGQLCHKVAWGFLSKNYNNQHTEDQSDIVQRLRIDMMRAGSYYKRQRFIENGLDVLIDHVSDPVVCRVVGELIEVWESRRRGDQEDRGLSNLQRKIIDRHASNPSLKKVVSDLAKTWKRQLKAETKRRKFGQLQESILESLLKKHVPSSIRPSRLESLDIDEKFATYCKQIIYNSVKSLGKRVTKEKSYRSGMVSLSEFDYLCES